MIIKKKYAAVKKVIDEAPAEDTLSVIDDAVQAYENMNEDELEGFEEEAAPDFETDETENNDEQELTAEEERKQQDIDDLDLSLENIQFAPREERREGTRRRGYRRSQDRNIVTRAQHEAVSIREAAKKDGYNEGIKAAQEDLQQIKDRLAEFFDCRKEVFDKVSGCILDISMKIAEKILEKEIEENREYILPLIKSLTEDIDKTENKILLKVMPKDAEIVKDKISEIFDTNYFQAKISVIPDNSVKDGGVIVETSNGIIDASIDTRLAIMEQALKKPEEGG